MAAALPRPQLVCNRNLQLHQSAAGPAALNIVSVCPAGRYGQQLRNLTAQTVAQASLLLKKSSKRGARTRRHVDQMTEGLQQTASTVQAAKASEEAEQAIQEMMQAAGGAWLLKLHAIAQGSHSTARHWCRLPASCLRCCCCSNTSEVEPATYQDICPSMYTHCCQLPTVTHSM